ncbi:MAG: hypothetical protein N2560_10385 [Ignavibacteria bacterium]|nr:hypothetical protein [Ignavibacteria bacterium]
MNKVKLLFLFIIITLVIGGIIYLFVTQKPPIYNVKILILNNDYLQIDTILQNISDKLALELSKNKPNQLNFTYFTTTRIFKPYYELKIRPGENIENWKFRIKTYLYSTLHDSVLVSLENQKVNDLVLNFISEAFTEKDNLENTYYLITGTFPECFDYESKKSLINSVKELVKKRKEKDKVRLISALVDPRKNIEKEIFDSLNATNMFEIKKIDIDLEKERKCIPLDVPKIFCIFLNKFTQPTSLDILDFISKNVGNRFFVTFWNDGPKNGSTQLYLSRNIDSLEFLNYSSSMTKCDWSSLNFLFKQSYHQLSTMPDTLNKLLFFIGKFPEPSNQRLLNKEFWVAFSKIPNMVWYHFLPKGEQKGYLESNFFPVLQKYYKIKIYKNY